MKIHLLEIHQSKDCLLSNLPRNSNDSCNLKATEIVQSVLNIQIEASDFKASQLMEGALPTIYLPLLLRNSYILSKKEEHGRETLSFEITKTKKIENQCLSRKVQSIIERINRKTKVAPSKKQIITHDTSTILGTSAIPTTTHFKILWKSYTMQQ